MYNKVVLLATTCILLPYLFSSLYGFKVSKMDRLGNIQLVVAGAAITSSFYVLFAVRLNFLAASFIIYALGIFVYIKAKQEHQKIMSRNERFAIAAVPAC